MDMLVNTFMRAPGESVGTFALECAIDELADAMAIDPVELRQRLEPGKDPTTGQAFSSRHIVEAYANGAERFGWNKRNPTPGARREGEWLIGMGVATATYPYYRMAGGKARIKLTNDGRAVVQMASHVVDTTTTVNSLAYTYDAADNVKTITDAVTAGNNQAVNYDAIDRLSSATGSYPKPTIP